MKWIKVTERLPESECRVLCVLKGYTNNMKVLNFEPKIRDFDACFTDDECIDITEFVTHWQPLPKFPNE